MQYHGKLYGKMGRHLIPLKLTSEDVDRMEAENARLREILGRLQNCATACLGWHSDNMSLGAVREVTQAVKDAEDILSNKHPAG
jgi:hypothetical protein